ncbi:MAG: MgtE integral membrane protein [Parcubacteria group bacterium GW2011_GWF2_46_8]|nr:MAG: MgtE integral membrane protein [Parcubacteria group bacterium GW2011_GWF1_45_5]KKU47071.1 MAG: MgtE integral membrane protein [Parcubacteria group bacterium GW2011_GWF2_46_8]
MLTRKYTEDNVMTERVDHLIEHRIPWLLIGVLGGLLATIIVSKFEAVLATNTKLAFFIPIIVYLSDAVGTQTETIFIRELSHKKIHFVKYIFKESMVGFGLGIIVGLILALFAWYWLGSISMGLTIGLTMLINLTTAPFLAVCIPMILYRKRSDPALGSGPVATIIQDLISLLTYFFIASLIIF